MGAFDYGEYRFGMDGRKDSRLAAAIKAFKDELLFNGFAKALDFNVPVFGDAMKNRVIEFQTARALNPTGHIGPDTAQELFRKRIMQLEANYAFPKGTLGKQLKLESGFDPVAIGQDDHDDKGMAQINLRIHTNVTVAQAYTPSFAISWMAQYIKQNFNMIAVDVGILKAARAAYNIGEEYAKRWMLAGFPASGGPTLGGQDSFTRATNYVKYLDDVSW